MKVLKKMSLYKEYKGYLIVFIRWVDLIGRIKHNVVALKTLPMGKLPNQLTNREAFNQAIKEDTTGNPLYTTEYTSLENALKIMQKLVDAKLEKDEREEV